MRSSFRTETLTELGAAGMPRMKEGGPCGRKINVVEKQKIMGLRWDVKSAGIRSAGTTQKPCACPALSQREVWSAESVVERFRF